MKAIYVSVWDGGTEIRTSCEYNPETGEVSDIETADVSGIEVLEDEYIELPDGTEVRDFVDKENESSELTDEEVSKLKAIFKK